MRDAVPLHRSGHRFGLSSWWLVLPVLTMGLATAFPFIYAGLRHRRRPLLIFGAGYLVAGGACIALLSSSPSDTGWPSATGAVIALALVGLVGPSPLPDVRRIVPVAGSGCWMSDRGF